MYKKNTLLILLLLGVPACCRRTQKEVITTTRIPCGIEKVEEVIVKPESKPIFADDVEGFALEEPGNSFSAPTEESAAEDISIVEQEAADESWADKRLEQAQIYGLKTIYFNYDDYDIRPDQQSVLEYDLKKVQDLVNKGSTVVVEGHACLFAKSPVYNMHLSEKRADSVANYFMEKGISREKLKVVGRGAEMCVVSEGDMEQQSVNRRVELYPLENKADAA